VYAIGTGQNSSYSYAACFHDTKTGNNFSSASPGAFPAVAGYDLCTGWGTPSGVGLINALSLSSNGTVSSTNTTTGSTNTTGSSSANLGISPGSGSAFSGVAGGPFTPASGIFQITNESSFAVSWSLVSTSAWLKVQTSGGTLAANAAVNVTVSLAATANTLKMGSYSTSLAFANVAAHNVQEIPVTLQVNQPVTLSSAQGFSASGIVGGPFSPASQTFILTNLSSSTTSWSLVNTSSWLSVSASSGTVAARGHVIVTVSPSTSAKSLNAGVYAGNIRFNSASGQIAAVPFSLVVVAPILQNGGFETGSFSGWVRSGNLALTSVTRLNSSYVHGGNYGANLGPTGSPGYLSQTMTTVPGQTYILSLWLRNAVGRVPAWFQVQWNGAPIFLQTDFNDRNWTNLQFLVTATTASSALQLGFQGGPREALGLDDVSLLPVANASSKFVARKSDDFQLIWNTSAGTLYQAQYKTNLSQPDWINLGAPTPAGAETLTMTDTNALQISPQRFYRLLAIPPP
ncbi:MAG TPA: carbohydrate binding domain-containing protein, partial [Verrucomicrobiae bacterium]|nr:carbohydrate binding domain-containing protein [Verrucomicrobiae bacterium]